MQNLNINSITNKTIIIHRLFVKEKRISNVYSPLLLVVSSCRMDIVIPLTFVVTLDSTLANS